MVDDLTSCVQATGTQARICALLVHAGPRRWTFGADNAFRSTRRRRAEITAQA